MFTQCFCLLINRSVSLLDLRSILEENGYGVVKENWTPERWQFSGPSLLIPYIPGVNGYVTIDVVNERWPDAMGDPKADTTTFGAWSMGFFGPFTFPGGLSRARDHSRSWGEGQRVTQLESGFIRVRLSYALGAGKDAAIIPKERDPLRELTFLNRLTFALLGVAGVFAYFNPNGEVLLDRASFTCVFEGCAKGKFIPVQLWANCRSFVLNGRLGLMDLVGSGQFDRRDVEAFFPIAQYRGQPIGDYLSNVTIYLIGLQRELRTGESIDGPNETNLTWTIESLDESLASPPQRVVRLYPKASRDEVHGAVSEIQKSRRYG